MIRILHVIGSLDVGGSQVMVMNLYRAIDRNKIQFDFIVDRSESGFFSAEVKELGGRIYTMPSFSIQNMKNIKVAWKQFFNENPEYNILHCHVRSYASIYIPIAKHFGVKTIIHSHSTSNGSGISSFVKAVLQYPLRYQADYFFGCSRIAGEWLFGKNVVNGERYHNICNAVSVDKFHFSEEKRFEVRKELIIPDGTVVYGHIGRLHESKNHHFLIELFRELHEINSKSILLLVGDGKLRSQIENSISKLRLNESVKLLGSRTDIDRLLMAMDCFLFPSKWEGFPVVVIEAQATGLPCFVSNTITAEVGVSQLVHYMPIEKGVQLWVDQVTHASFQRNDVGYKIKQAGFDIKQSSEWLMDFYEGLVRV